MACLRVASSSLGDALKQNTLNTGRLALRGVAAAAMLFCAINASALGLGRLSVQSGLGETLKAEIEVTSLTPEESSNLKVRVAPPESYRAAGVEYNAVLPATRVEVQRRSDGRTFLRITSNRAVQEPFVDVILELSWSTGRLVREYTMLFDPPSNRVAAPSLQLRRRQHRIQRHRLWPHHHLWPKQKRRAPAAVQDLWRVPVWTSTRSNRGIPCRALPVEPCVPGCLWIKCWCRCTKAIQMRSWATT